MSLYKAMQNLKYDKRLTERNLTTGQVTKEEWQQHLDKLPDMSHNIDVLNMEGDDQDDIHDAH